MSDGNLTESNHTTDHVVDSEVSDDYVWLTTTQAMGYPEGLTEAVNHISLLTASFATAVFTALGAGKAMIQAVRKLWTQI